MSNIWSSFNFLSIKVKFTQTILLNTSFYRDINCNFIFLIFIDILLNLVMFSTTVLLFKTYSVLVSQTFYY